jgi:ParB-like chromosome segregation protein Spo0J
MAKNMTNDKVLGGPNSVKIELEWRDPRELTPYTRNSKLHTPEQVAKIAAQIIAFGMDQPIVIRPNGVIIKGHGRREAALSIGMKRVPVIVSQLTDVEAAASRIGDNKVTDILRQEFDYLKQNNYDPTHTGFDVQEHSAICEGWSAAPTKAEPEGEDLGLMARVTINCLQKDRERVVTAVEAALRASGLAEAKIL